MCVVEVFALAVKTSCHEVRKLQSFKIVNSILCTLAVYCVRYGSDEVIAVIKCALLWVQGSAQK